MTCFLVAVESLSYAVSVANFLCLFIINHFFILSVKPLYFMPLIEGGTKFHLHGARLKNSDFITSVRQYLSAIFWSLNAWVRGSRANSKKLSGWMLARSFPIILCTSWTSRRKTTSLGRKRERGRRTPIFLKNLLMVASRLSFWVWVKLLQNWDA